MSDEELEAYYRDNERRLTLPEQVRVRHILLTWKPLGTTDDRAAIREQMVPILERARAGEDFAALAREFSDDYATKESGGDTGLFRRGQMAPAFEQAAFALREPGEISGPVETAFGVHILQPGGAPGAAPAAAGRDSRAVARPHPRGADAGGGGAGDRAPAGAERGRGLDSAGETRNEQLIGDSKRCTSRFLVCTPSVWPSPWGSTPLAAVSQQGAHDHHQHHQAAGDEADPHAHHREMMNKPAEPAKSADVELLDLPLVDQDGGRSSSSAT